MEEAEKYPVTETMEVGRDTGTPVVRDYFDQMPFAYSSDLERVIIDLEPRAGKFERCRREKKKQPPR